MSTSSEMVSSNTMDLKVVEKKNVENINEEPVGSGGYSSDSSTEQVDVSTLDPETLKARIKAQVEYYFSQQNLQNDAYMMSQMNAEGYIPVSVIGSFKKVLKLTNELSMIVDAVSDSTVCELNEDKTMLKTSWKRPARTTIILRDVQQDTVETDIKELFVDTEFNVVSARSDVGQTWFVTMGSEDDAKNAVLHLLGKTLHGFPVKARLKSEARPMATTQQQQAQPNFPYPAYQQQQSFDYYSTMGWSGNMGQFQQNVDQQQQQRPNRQDMKKYPSGGSGNKKMGEHNKRNQQSVGGRGTHGNRRPQTQSGANVGNRKKKVTVGKRSQPKTPVFKPQDFPSLPLGKLTLEGENETSMETKMDETTPIESKENEQVQEQENNNNSSSSQNSSDEPTTQSSSTGGSWAATVAKAPPPAPVKPTPSPETQQTNKKKGSPPPPQQQQAQQKGGRKGKKEKKQQNNNNNNNNGPKQQQQQQANNSNETSSNTKIERPKRGWEKPGVVASSSKPATTTEVKQIVNEVIGESVKIAEETNTENDSSTTPTPITPSVSKKKDKVIVSFVSDDEDEEDEVQEADTDKALLKSAFGAWGGNEKKSFADIIKTTSGDESSLPNTQNTSNSTSTSNAAKKKKDNKKKDREGGSDNNNANKKKEGPKVTTLEGNWRKANRSRASK